MVDTENVTRVEYEGREFYVIGTAHISQHSVDEVTRTILELRPDTVCVELDQTRHDGLIDDSGWRRLDIGRAISEKRVLFLLVSLALSAYQKRMGDKLGVRPGAELLAAVTAAREVGALLVLADRDVQVTLKRAWRGLSAKEKLQLLGLGAAPVGGETLAEELTAERVEQLKDRKTMTDMLAEMAKALPGIKRPLIDERDLYLISSLREAPGKRVVSVVGAGHVPGMLANLRTPVDRSELEQVPPPSAVSQALRWLIPALVLTTFWIGYSRQSLPGLQALLTAWAYSNSVAVLVLLLLARANPLTLIVASALAPLLGLDPTKSASKVAGLLELRLRRPTDQDKQGVKSDILSLRGFYSNRFTRVAWVSVLAGLGSTLGSWVGLVWMLSLL